MNIKEVSHHWFSNLSPVPCQVILEPMPIYGHLDPQQHNYIMCFVQNSDVFSRINTFHIVVCKMLAILSWHQRAGGYNTAGLILQCKLLTVPVPWIVEFTKYTPCLGICLLSPTIYALGHVSYGGVQLRGPNPYPILGKAGHSETYPILGKSHNPGHPKRSGIRKHTLF